MATKYQRIQESLRLEKLSAEFYATLAGRFPEEQSFWDELKDGELNHYDILKEADRFNAFGELPDEVVFPSLSIIKSSVDTAADLCIKGSADGVSLKDALELALELEQTTAEEYFQAIMTMTTDSRVIQQLQDMLKDEYTHADKITAKLEEKGFHA